MPKKRIARKLKKEQKKIINAYLDNLRNKINVRSVVLFGSYAYGKPDKHSDIDLVVLSNDFEKMNFFQRLKLLSLMRKGMAEDIAMDVVGYTPKEFKNIEKESAILNIAKKQGITLFDI